MPISSQVPAEIKQNSTQANKASCQANFKAKLQTEMKIMQITNLLVLY